MTTIEERLRRTTERMANEASVDMALWNEHSNAALEAIATIVTLRQQLAAAQDDIPPLYRCTACEAESEGDPPDCPRDGVHCNVVEVG